MDCVVELEPMADCACCLTTAGGQGDTTVSPAHIPRKNKKRKRQKVTRAIPARPFRLRRKVKYLADAFEGAEVVFLRGGIENYAMLIVYRWWIVLKLFFSYHPIVRFFFQTFLF